MTSEHRAHRAELGLNDEGHAGSRRGTKTYGARNASDKRTAVRQVAVSVLVIAALALLTWAFMF